MPATLERIVLNVGGKKPRRAMLEGRPHLVAPARILKEEVLNGSGGPGFYPHDENKKNLAAWNHMPIVIDHPDVDGTPVSARTPDVLNSRKVGVILNATANDAEKAVDVECWFDEELTKQVDKRVHVKVNNGEAVECSTGLFLNADTGTKGQFGEKKYDWVAREQNPDHLAVLLDKVGALSIGMGGGIFANESKEPESHLYVQKRTAENALRGVGIEFVGNELSFNTISRFLSDALSSTHGEKGRYWDGWVSDVFSDHVVYMDGKGKMFKQNYSATDKGISLSGKPVEVVQQVSYQPVGNSAGASQEQKMDRTAKINSLIGNGGYAEADRAWLEALNDTALAAIKPVVANAAPPAVPPPAAPTPPPATGTVLTPEDLAVLNYGRQVLNQQRTVMVNALKATGRCPYSDDHLNKLPPAELEALCKLAGAVPGAPPAATTPPASGMFANGYSPGWLGMGGFPGAVPQNPQFPNGFGANYLLNSAPPPAAGGKAEEEEPLEYPVLNGQATKKNGAAA